MEVGNSEEQKASYWVADSWDLMGLMDRNPIIPPNSVNLNNYVEKWNKQYGAG